MKNKNMKKIYIHKIYATLFLVPALCIGVPANAQKSSGNSAEEDNVHTGMERTKKAWEIGVGGTGLQMTRFNVWQAWDFNGAWVSTFTPAISILFCGQE